MRSRILASAVARAAKDFPALVLSGPRQAGKTTLLRALLPGGDYRLLEDPEQLARVKSDPVGWLDSCRPPVIIDEIQNAPELLPYIRSRIDGSKKKGAWYLTGSQHFGLIKGISESMAGRAAIFTLWPFSIGEIGRMDNWTAVRRQIVRGFYPPPALAKAKPSTWYSSFLQTYIQRDISQLSQVADLATFTRFVQLCAARVGQILDQSDLAAPLGVSVPTIARWISILETTAQLIVLRPYYENVSKRLVKRPKLYFGDTGLLCHLLGIETVSEYEKSPFRGAIFENLVLLEILKSQAHRGGRWEAWFFRDRDGLEVDFLAPVRGKLLAVEAKSGSTPTPADANSLRKFVSLAEKKRGNRLKVHPIVVTASGPMGTLAPGIPTQPLCDFVRSL